jgi:DEAD/DEAH box helicase domain-containing protein
VLPLWLSDDPRVVHVEHLTASSGQQADWPAWAPEDVVRRAHGQGILRPWRHQVEAADALRSGQHVALSTGTASGKSLAYLLPILEATAQPGLRPAPKVSVDDPLRHPLLPGLGEDMVDADEVPSRPDLAELLQATRSRRTTALYLAPTKALAHDQLRNAWLLGPHGWGITALDGDSDTDERRFARDYATVVLTNPDMLHSSVLPNHAAWASFLSGLRYVVVDESHRYRGVFGAHVALVLRRLRRLCARYGTSPTFLCSSATAVDSRDAMACLIGEPPEGVVVVDEDTSPRGTRDIVLWQPYESTDADVAQLLGRFVAEGRQTLAFVSSRRAAEQVSRQAAALAPLNAVSAYRGGYLARERRALEKALRTGALRGVATTNALELGVDIAGVDAVVMGGYPGSVASLWQQAGRAGRRGGDAAIVLVARNDPLDAYLFDHPEQLFTRSPEAVVLHPENPAVLGPHLGAAAQELPLAEADDRWFGPILPPLLDRLTAHGTLRRRPTGWYWPHLARAVDTISIRSTGGPPIEIIEESTGRILGTVDPVTADRVVHPGAVYLHQGEHWLVTELNGEECVAYATAASGEYDTIPVTESDVTICTEQQSQPTGRGSVHRGVVDVRTQVVAFLRRRCETGEVIGRAALELPPRTLRTHAVWFTLPSPATRTSRVRAGAHAVEHLLVSLLASVAGSDRGDVAGEFSVRHPDTDAVTVIVYDTAPGGAGFARAGYDRAQSWLAIARDRLAHCSCESGCPRCCIIPGCPVANDDIDKASALRLLRSWTEKTDITRHLVPLHEQSPV